jgi:two-component system NtrC family sensor kinase
MSRPILSIKLKVILTFVFAFVVIVVLLATTGYLMQLLQTRVVILEEVSRLEEKIQDLRRYEKNLFLYHDMNSGQRTFSLIKDAQRILASNRAEFERIFSQDKIQTFAKHLQQYEQAMTDYLNVDSQRGSESNSKSKAEQTKIRETGSRLLMYAESIAKQKRRNIRKSIRDVNRLQLVEALFVAVGLLFFGGLVLGKVVHPLKSLQDHAYRIGKGDFREIESPSQEHEVGDVYKAFNRMTRDLKKRETDLVRSRHLASLGTLLAGVAHELNNPLSNIRSTCQILAEDKGDLDEDFRRKSELAIIEEVDKAGVIVRDLLELSRGKENVKELCNVKSLIKRTLSLLHSQIPSEVETVVTVSEDQSIFVDSQGILQVLMNVISNAVDAMEGEGRIVIEAQSVVDGHVDIVITDTGSGVEEDDLNRVFDPFFSTKDVGKGTGLGLFITHQIMERNNGRVMIKSVPGKGTTVVLRIPAEEKFA